VDKKVGSIEHDYTSNIGWGQLLVISIQGIKLPKKLQSPWFLSYYMTKILRCLTLHKNMTMCGIAQGIFKDLFQEFANIQVDEKSKILCLWDNLCSTIVQNLNVWF